MKVPTVVIVILVAAVVILVVVNLWVTGYFDVKCDPEYQVQITGVLQGFTSNSSHREFTDIRVDNLNYTFYTFDREMALHFVGSKMEINACYQQNTTRSIKNYYDMISIFLIEE